MLYSVLPPCTRSTNHNRCCAYDNGMRGGLTPRCKDGTTLLLLSEPCFVRARVWLRILVFLSSMATNSSIFHSENRLGVIHAPLNRLAGFDLLHRAGFWK